MKLSEIRSNTSTNKVSLSQIREAVKNGYTISKPISEEVKAFYERQNYKNIFDSTQKHITEYKNKIDNDLLPYTQQVQNMIDTQNAERAKETSNPISYGFINSSDTMAGTALNNWYKAREKAKTDANQYKVTDKWDIEQKAYLSELYKQDPEKALEFASDVNRAIENNEIYELGKKYPLMSGVVSVASNLGNIIEQPINVAEYVGGKIRGDENVKLGRSVSADVTNALRSGGANNETISSLKIGDWNLGGFVYQNLLNLADIVVSSIATSGISNAVSGKLAGKVPKLIEKFASNLAGGSVLGMSAAASATNDVLDRGGTSEQALGMGTAAYFFETLFETLSLSELKGFKETGAGLLKEAFKKGGNAKVIGEIAKNIARSLGVNASEELLTEASNYAYDYLVNADISQFATSVENYMANGMTEEQARQQVAKDFGVQLAEAAASGAFIGLLGGGGNAVSSYRDARSQLKAEGALKPKTTKKSQNLPEVMADTIKARKQAQADIIKAKTGADIAADTIYGLEEVIDSENWSDTEEFAPDFTRDNALEAVQNGEITVYSNTPIENGAEVTPSKAEAEAQGGTVYKKTISIDNAAWTSPTTAVYTPEVQSDISQSDKYAKSPSFWKAKNQNETISETLKSKIGKLFSGKDSRLTIGDITRQIQKDFGIPISTGKFRQRAYGIYKVNPEAIRTKIANALPTIAHELGHHLDKLYNLTFLNSIAEAERVLKETRPDFYAAYSGTARPGEAVAEFIRDYLSDRALAKEKYPFFYEEFTRVLGEKGKKDLQNLNAIGDLINEYMNMSIADRMRASVIERNEAKKRNILGTKLSDVLDSVKSRLLDEANILKKVSKKAYDLYYWAKKSSVRAKNTIGAEYMSGFLSDHAYMRDENGLIVKDENGKPIIAQSLKYAISGISWKDRAEFDRYLLCRHALEWIAQDKRVWADDTLNNADTVNKEIQELEKSHPEFKEAAENFYSWYRTFMYEYGVRSGLMTREQWQGLIEKYPNYVPFMRNVDKSTYGSKAGVANQKAPIQRAKGSGAEILSITENIVLKIEQFMKAADRNSVMRVIADVADDKSGLGYLLEKVPPDMIPVTVSLEQATNKAAQTMEDMGATQQEIDDFSNLIDRLIGDSITAFRIGQNQGFNVVAVMKNGKREYYQVHNQDLLNALTGLQPEQFNSFTKAIGSITRVFKALTTGRNPVWSLASNAPRDFDQAFKYSSENNIFKFTKDYLRAFKAAFNAVTKGQESEIYKIYKAVGGGYNSALINGREMRSTVRDIFVKDKSNIKERIGSFFSIIETIEEFSGAVETAPRLAEFERVYKKTGDAVAALKAAEEITVNFNRRGTTGKLIDQYVPYFNASIQGTQKFINTLGQSLKRGGDKSFIVKSVVSALIKVGMIFAIGGLFGDEWEEEYNNLSAYKKNNFYNIYIGGGEFISIPKSQTTAVFDSALERTIELAMKNDPDFSEEAKDFFGYIWSIFCPPLFDENIILGGMLEYAKNETFTGAPIVPEYMEDLQPEMQYNEKTTETAKAIGQLFGWSPMKLDHFINSYLGVFGTLNKALAHESPDFSLGLKNKFITDSAYSTDIFNKFYDAADKAASFAKSYPDNAEYLYDNKQYSSIKKVVSELNQYGKDDEEIARDYKIYSQDFINEFNNSKNQFKQQDKKLLELLSRTNDKDVLYYKDLSAEFTKDKVKHRMDAPSYMDYVTEYYQKVRKEYAKIFDMNLSDEVTAAMLKDAKTDISNALSDKYKIVKKASGE